MKRTINKDFFTTERAIILYLMIAKILFHLLHPEYGYFRDEMYYFAIGDGFSFQNMELSPLTPLFLKLITSIFGYSIKAFHFASALCGALSIMLTCLITRELGGKKYAVLLTGIFMFFSGFLIFGAMITYDSLDFLIQVMALYLLVRIIKNSNPKLWILLGVVLGLGLFNKLTVLFFGAALFIGLWLVPQRKHYKSIWIWLTAAIAFSFTIPMLVWQYQHDWYYLDYASRYSGGIAYVPSFLEFLWGQILPNNLFGLPIWLLGLGGLLFSPQFKKYRLLGYMYLLMFFIYFFVGAKFYFLIPMYSILFAVGAIKIEEYFQRNDISRVRVKRNMVMLPVIYVILSLPLLPMIVPVLPIEKFVAYASKLSVHAGVRHESMELKNLPQHVADRFGWPEMTEQMANIHHRVSAELNEEVGILTSNYGQAGAFHLLGTKYNLPEPISTHGWFYYEALRTNNFHNNYISMGLSENHLKSIFEEVISYGKFTHPYCVPYENNNPIFLCRKPKYDFRSYWLTQKSMDKQFLDLLENESP